jgi:hypothetical protein
MARGGFDSSKFINIHQVGGIDAYQVDDGQGRGVRALCVNTGGGLRYRVLVDRGLDIDQAFHNQHSLTFLSHKGVTPPTRALDRGLDWLRGTPVGLLASCGPFNIGTPTTDQGEELGLHGPHSNTAAELESVIQPDPRRGQMDMSVTGRVRYGGLYGPCVELRRTIRSTLGRNDITIEDEFFNAGNSELPHAWLLHWNFGYPLLDEGAEFEYELERLEPRDHPPSKEYFTDESRYRRVPAPLEAHRGEESVIAYLYPKPDADGMASIGIVNRKLPLRATLNYSPKQFPRCGQWLHFGPHEYVAGLEPMNGTVEGRDKDRAAGLMDTLKPGERRSYTCRLSVTDSA